MLKAPLGWRWRAVRFGALAERRTMSSVGSTPDGADQRSVDILGRLGALLSPRISTKRLAQLCRRFSTMLGAGVDIRTLCQREVERPQPPALRQRMLSIRDAVARGESITEAIEATGDYFPPLFRQMVRVGEQTGYLSEVLQRLAEHYEQRVAIRQRFLATITWPMIQLAIAVVVVGLLIWIMGMIAGTTDVTVDPLGLGLVGTTGLIKYTAFWVLVVLGVFVVWRAAGRGLVWTRPIQRLVLQIPGVGSALQTLAVARFAWALHLTLESGMPLRDAMRLSIRSTRNARYTDHEGAIDRSIAAGHTIYETLTTTGAFPADFLDAVHVGEESGRLVESMEHLAEQYNQQAAAALKTLATFAGWGVWALVAMMIIAMIFRLFFFYLSQITGAL
ncbi:MAG TPA: type II secretion system F family protein [Planctomycetes bacterium]|nr:type II secretion system F family protein [Planctomycetota bacterium]